MPRPRNGEQAWVPLLRIVVSPRITLIGEYVKYQLAHRKQVISSQEVRLAIPCIDVYAQPSPSQVRILVPAGSCSWSVKIVGYEICTALQILLRVKVLRRNVWISCGYLDQQGRKARVEEG